MEGRYEGATDVNNKIFFLSFFPPSLVSSPTNNALLINFRLISDAEILLLSTDWACTLAQNVQKHVCNMHTFRLSFHFACHRCWLGPLTPENLSGQLSLSFSLLLSLSYPLHTFFFLASLDKKGTTTSKSKTIPSNSQGWNLGGGREGTKLFVNERLTVGMTRTRRSCF